VRVAFEWERGAGYWTLYVFALDPLGVHAGGCYLLSESGPPFMWERYSPTTRTTKRDQLANALQARTIEEAKLCLEVIARMG
jgi:hypothetical protein